MVAFNHTLARFAVWNLAGNDKFPGGDGDGISPDERKSWHQVLGLALLDAEFVTLVEVFPDSHIDLLAERLTEKDIPVSVRHDETGFVSRPIGGNRIHLAVQPNANGCANEQPKQHGGYHPFPAQEAFRQMGDKIPCCRPNNAPIGKGIFDRPDASDFQIPGRKCSVHGGDAPPCPFGLFVRHDHHAGTGKEGRLYLGVERTSVDRKHLTVIFHTPGKHAVVRYMIAGSGLCASHDLAEQEK